LSTRRSRTLLGKGVSKVQGVKAGQACIEFYLPMLRMLTLFGGLARAMPPILKKEVVMKPIYFYTPEAKSPKAKRWGTFDEVRALEPDLREARYVIDAWRENYPKYRFRIVQSKLVKTKTIKCRTVKGG